jgi:hypothetical protein
MTTSRSEKRSRRSLDWVLTLIIVALFGWLRWWSGLWHNRWIGFVLGAVIVVAFVPRDWRRPGQDIQARGFYLRLSIAFFAMGIFDFVRFLWGADGDTGLGVFIMLALGVQQAYMYRYVSVQHRLHLPAKD